MIKVGWHKSRPDWVYFWYRDYGAFDIITHCCFDLVYTDDCTSINLVVE